MNLRRRTVVAAAMGPLAASAIVFAQVAGKVWRIGFLLNGTNWENLILRRTLADEGLVDGRNIQFEVRSSQGQQERLDSLAAELVAAKVDLIVALLNPEVQAVKRATTTVPIVMLYATAPVETGLVASLARPGGNVTGTTTSDPAIAGKMIELMRDLVPRLRRIAIVSEPDYPGMSLYHLSAERAAVVMGIELDYLAVRTAPDIDNALKSIERNRPSAVLVSMTGPMLPIANYQRIIEFAAHQRLPAIYSISAPARRGGLMSYGPDFGAMARRNASVIDRILKGARPADIPVEAPALYELILNMRTARALGIAVPKSLLFRATEVIE